MYSRDIRETGSRWFWRVLFNGLMVREGSTSLGREEATNQAIDAQSQDRRLGHNACDACKATIVSGTTDEHAWHCVGRTGAITLLYRKNLNVRTGFRGDKQ